MAHPIELDKPSTSPLGPTESDDDLRLLEERSDDRTNTVLRDAQGNIVFPSYVPPDVDSPNSPVSPKKTKSEAGTEREPVATRILTRDTNKARTEPLPEADGPAAGEQHVGRSVSLRPSFKDARKFVSELPRRGERHVSLIPGIKRAGTNVSQLNREIWNRQMEDGSSMNSSSDDDDDGDETDEAPVTRTSSGPRRQQSDDRYRRFNVANKQYSTRGKVSRRDGRLNITVNDTSNTGYLAKAIGSAVMKVVPTTAKKTRDGRAQVERPTPSRISSATTETSERARVPKLNIVIMVIGSRGDAQPFLKIGKVLKEQYGHRVRIATHPAFRDFVEKDSGLEFFSVGGDPSELMAFMVKNPGMIPKLETVKAGDIGRRRAAMAEMFEGFWRACISATDNEKDTRNLKMMGEKAPFVADAIIANPPSFAHVHCAEALGIPLHLMFTFPYTPTQAFPHPLASIKKSNVDPGYTNFISYPLVEMMVWQGLGDLVNDFRVKTLGLDPVSTLWAPGSTYRLHVPFTYLWSPAIVPKPEDWGEEIDISGYVFLELASSFQPPQDLVDFLDQGDAPIYIGFGSIVVDDPEKFTEMIFKAVELAGVRALVSKGWGGLGGGDDAPDNIYMLDNTPHDWLFPKVRACAIHGGAGTTAISLKCGKPTMIVPFFGDQNFWGSMVSNSGAGPEPVPYKKLSAEKLAEGIKYCLTDEALEAAQKIAKDIELEGDGAKNAIKSFHHHLGLNGDMSMRCSILSDRVAVWRVKDTSLKLSALAADILVERGYISWRRLRLIRHKEWNDFAGPGEPLTGIAGTIMGTISGFFGGFGSVPYRLAKTSKKREHRKQKKEARKKQGLKQKQKALEPKASGENDTAEFPFPHQASSEALDQQQASEGRRPPFATQGTNNSILTSTTPGVGNPAREYTTEVSEGFEQSGRALARAPVDLAMAVAQGFHNAPRLYGDDTVRRPPRVTGIRSGLRAAGSEFVYGIYDGFTGLVRLPIKGARERGFPGAVAGFGMGIGGFVLKNISAIISPVGYTLKGLAKQIERRGHPAKYVRRARIVQAQREMREMSDDDRETLCEATYHGWDVMHQLAEAIMREDAKRSLISGRLNGGGGSNINTKQLLSRWAKGRAFESIEVAEKALAALQRGEDLDAVIPGRRGRSFDLRRSFVASASEDRIQKAEKDKKGKSQKDKAESEKKTIHLPHDKGVDDREGNITMEKAVEEVDNKARQEDARAVQEDIHNDTLPPTKQDKAPLVTGGVAVNTCVGA